MRHMAWKSALALKLLCAPDKGIKPRGGLQGRGLQVLGGHAMPLTLEGKHTGDSEDNQDRLPPRRPLASCAAESGLPFAYQGDTEMRKPLRICQTSPFPGYISILLQLRAGETGDSWTRLGWVWGRRGQLQGQMEHFEL